MADDPNLFDVAGIEPGVAGRLLQEALFDQALDVGDGKIFQGVTPCKNACTPASPNTSSAKSPAALG